MSISSETISYGQIDNQMLLTIFGAEMTYNDLKSYAKNINETTHLQVKTFTVTENQAQIITVLFDNQEVFEREYSLNHSCDMFYHLKQMEQQCDECGEMGEQGLMCEFCKEESDDEEEESCDCCMKGWDAENKYGRCICFHDHCQDLLRNCKYNCC